MKKDKLRTVILMEVGNMPTGTRFIAGGHSTLLIATNAFQTADNVKTRMCVSENGSAKWIPVKNRFKRFDIKTTYRFSRLSKEIISEYMDTITSKIVIDLKIKSETLFRDQDVITALGQKTVNVIRKYMANEMFDGDENAVDDSPLTIGTIGEKLKIAKLRKHWGCGDTTIRKIIAIFGEADIKIQ